jgi:hypothetical protein
MKNFLKYTAVIVTILGTHVFSYADVSEQAKAGAPQLTLAEFCQRVENHRPFVYRAEVQKDKNIADKFVTAQTFVYVSCREHRIVSEELPAMVAVQYTDLNFSFNHLNYVVPKVQSEIRDNILYVRAEFSNIKLFAPQLLQRNFKVEILDLVGNKPWVFDHNIKSVGAAVPVQPPVITPKPQAPN